jgi:asparagine synthase (glutamine-hydrolysing)
MKHAPDYQAVSAFAASQCLVGYVAYPQYPVKTTTTSAGNFVAIEGRIYNLSADEVRNELASLANDIFGGRIEAQAALARWTTTRADGEYCVIMVNKAGDDIIVFGDAVGCVPIYYHVSQTEFILARECKFIKALKPSIGFDRLGWAEMIWTDHPVGERTLLEGVRLMPWGGLLRAKLRGGNVHLDKCLLWEFNLDDKAPARSAEEHAREIADLFTELCRHWGSQPDVAANVVSMSGGQDSRALLTGLVRAGVKVQARTFLDHRGVAARDAELAEQVCKVLGVPWSVVRLGPPDQAAVDRVVRLKDGLNGSSMAFFLPFLDEVVAKHGRGALFMPADVGVLFPSVADSTPMAGVDDAVDRLFKRHSRTPAWQAESVMGLAPGSIAQDVRETLAAYPESGMGRRIGHWVIYERGRRYCYEGADRNRFFLWNGSPLYSFRMFQTCLRVPDSVKASYGLFAKFQGIMSPQCARIPDARMGAPIDSRRYRFKLKLWARARVLPKPLKDIARQIAGLGEAPYRMTQQERRMLDGSLASGGALEGVMDPQAARQLAEKCNRGQFSYFWALVTLANLTRAT